METNSVYFIIAIAVFSLLPHSSGAPTRALQSQVPASVPQDRTQLSKPVAKIVSLEGAGKTFQFEDEAHQLRSEHELISSASDDNIIGRQRRSFLSSLFGYPSGYYQRRWWPAGGNGGAHGHGHGHRHHHHFRGFRHYPLHH